MVATDQHYFLNTLKIKPRFTLLTWESICNNFQVLETIQSEDFMKVITLYELFSSLSDEILCLKNNIVFYLSYFAKLG